MKKILLGACALFLQFGLFAQQTETLKDAENTSNGAVSHGLPMGDATPKVAPFWTEDFASGMPTTWAVSDSSGICPWTYSVDGSWGNFNGNGGTAPAAAINSTSSLNGFLICDPDSANNVTYGQPSGTTYQYLSSYFTTSAIDCSTHPSVILNFEQNFRYNNGVALNVLVSNDSVTWTGYDVSGGMANNTESPDPDLVTLNITNIAANQATVYIKIGWSARVYFWMIDDISLKEAEANDVALQKNWWGTGAYQNHYYKIPTGQLSDVTFYSEVSNNTGGQLDDVYTTVDVVNGGGTDYSGTSPLNSLAAVEMDTFVVTSWLPSVVDLHTIDFNCAVTGQVDDDLTNNNFSDEMDITTSVYGLDNLQAATESTSEISNFSNNTGQQFRIGNVYEIINDDGIQCIEIGVADVAQNDGKSIYGEVHVWDDVNSVWELRGFTNVIDLVTNDLGTIMSLPLIDEAMVYAGEEALVVAGHYGGAIDGTDDVSFMYGQPVDDYMVYGFDVIGDAYWLSSPKAIVARADFDCGLSVDELSGNNIDVYPNPANTTITVDLNFSGEKVNISLLDLAGKTVYSNSIEGSVEMDVSKLAEGMYTVLISNGELQINKKISVVH